MPFNPFSALTSKIFGGLALAFLAVAVIQTIRIEGVWCSDVGAGEKPACIIRGFKQEVQIIEIDLAEAEANWRAEVAKHKATKQAYRDAQEEAARMEAERLARVVARQEEITSEVESDYRQRIAVVTSRAERLRRQARATDGSGAAGTPGDVQLPEAGDPTARTDEAPDCRPFPARDPLTEIRCREIAEAQATQLDELITWVERQFGVEP
ncbi:hypothetical protein [Microcystis phage Mae-JY29]